VIPVRDQALRRTLLYRGLLLAAQVYFVGGRSICDDEISAVRNTHGSSMSVVRWSPVRTNTEKRGAACRYMQDRRDASFLVNQPKYQFQPEGLHKTKARVLLID
jgi:hypothetical protein